MSIDLWSCHEVPPVNRPRSASPSLVSTIHSSPFETLTLSTLHVSSLLWTCMSRAELHSNTHRSFSTFASTQTSHNHRKEQRSTPQDHCASPPRLGLPCLNRPPPKALRTRGSTAPTSYIIVNADLLHNGRQPFQTPVCPSN